MNSLEAKINTTPSQMLKKYDCVAGSTNHASYDRTFIAKHARLIFDTRHACRDIKSNKIVSL